MWIFVPIFGIIGVAINFWSENKEQAPKDRVDYDLDYFKTEMNLINKRI